MLIRLYGGPHDGKVLRIPDGHQVWHMPVAPAWSPLAPAPAVPPAPPLPARYVRRAIPTIVREYEGVQPPEPYHYQP